MARMRAFHANFTFWEMTLLAFSSWIRKWKCDEKLRWNGKAAMAMGFFGRHISSLRLILSGKTQFPKRIRHVMKQCLHKGSDNRKPISLPINGKKLNANTDWNSLCAASLYHFQNQRCFSRNKRILELRSCNENYIAEREDLHSSDYTVERGPQTIGRYSSPYYFENCC